MAGGAFCGVSHSSRRGRLVCALHMEADRRAALFSLENPTFLHSVRNELKKHNPDGSGLLTLERFNEAIDHMGVAFGSPEMDRILKYCDLTPDGFVVFKGLLLATAPYRRQTVDSVKEAIAPPDPSDKTPLFPSEAAEGASRLFPPESGRYTGEQGVCARRLFSLWERSLLRDFQLKDALQQAGFRISEDFERLLSLKGPSGSVSFAAFIKALMADSPHPFSKAGNSVSKAALNAAARVSAPSRSGCFRDQQRDVVSWRQDEYDEDLTQTAKSEAWTSKPVESLTGRERQDFLQRIVALFLDSSLDRETFCWLLQRAGVSVSPAIETSLRRQEASGSVTFAKLMAAVMRADNSDANTSAAETLDLHEHSPDPKRCITNGKALGVAM